MTASGDIIVSTERTFAGLAVEKQNMAKVRSIRIGAMPSQPDKGVMKWLLGSPADDPIDWPRGLGNAAVNGGDCSENMNIV